MGKICQKIKIQESLTSLLSKLNQGSDYNEYEYRHTKNGTSPEIGH